MSEPLDDRSLDALIDEAARALTAADAPADLRGRVLARVRTDGERGWKARWLLPGVAVASACIAAVAIYVGSGFSRSNDSEVRSNADVGSGLSRSDGGPGSEPIRLKPDPTDVTPPTVALTEWVASSEPPPGFESIAAPELTIDALGVSGLTPPDALSVESIPLESIDVGALGTE